MTHLTGLIGYPISHSLSPAIHAYWLREYGIDGAYKLFTTQPPRLRQTMLHMRKKKAVGLNITIPHKQTVIPYLDGIDELARRVGAVNTITAKNGKLFGTNTDVYGFITNLRSGFSGQLERYLDHVVILGAGGATRAAIIALQEAGAKKITLLNRTLDSAEALAQQFSVHVAPWEARNSVIGSASLLVNTTSLGMQGQQALDLDLKQLDSACAVHDIVYAPLETKLLAYARLRNHPTVDGLGMLLYQAQAAFYSWHQVMPAITPELRTLLSTPALEPAP